jgi:hypothetical protein
MCVYVRMRVHALVLLHVCVYVFQKMQFTHSIVIPQTQEIPP